MAFSKHKPSLLKPSSWDFEGFFFSVYAHCSYDCSLPLVALCLALNVGQLWVIPLHGRKQENCMAACMCSYNTAKELLGATPLLVFFVSEI